MILSHIPAYLSKQKPQRFIINSQCCPGALLKNIGCRCQFEQPFMLTKSYAVCYATCTVFSMSSRKAMAGRLSEADKNSGRYHSSPMHNEDHPCRVFKQIKSTDCSSSRPGERSIRVNATRDVSRGLTAVPGAAVNVSTHACEVCQVNGETIRRADFVKGRKACTLYRFMRICITDTAEMLFEGSHYCPKLQEFLDYKGYSSIDAWLGYRDDDEDRIEEWELYNRKTIPRNELMSNPEGETCDCDHFLNIEPFYAHGKYATGGTGHTSNIVLHHVRDDGDEHCYGFSKNSYRR